MTARENMSFGLRQQKVEPAKIRRQVETAAGWGWKSSSSAARPSSRAASGSGWRWAGRGPQPGRAAHGRAALQSGRQLAVRTRPRSSASSATSASPRSSSPTTRRRRWCFSDRMVVIRSGKLQQVGPPMEVYRPANLFVAGFIGSPGYIRWRSSWHGPRPPAVPVGTAVIDLPLEVVEPASLASAGKAPRHPPHRPHRRAAQDGPVLRGEVFLVEPIGPISYVDLDVEGGRSRPWRIRIRHPHRATGSGHLSRPPGSPLRCGHGGAAVSGCPPRHHLARAGRRADPGRGREEWPRPRRGRAWPSRLPPAGAARRGCRPGAGGGPRQLRR